MIRNIVFSVFFFLGIIVISLIFLPTLFLPKKIMLFGGKLMGYWSGFCLKKVLSTKIIIKGKENIITNEKFFIIDNNTGSIIGRFSFSTSIRPIINQNYATCLYELPKTFK